MFSWNWDLIIKYYLFGGDWLVGLEDILEDFPVFVPGDALDEEHAAPDPLVILEPGLHQVGQVLFRLLKAGP